VLAGKRVVCLHIPDEFEYMDEDLVDRLRGGVGAYLEPVEKHRWTDDPGVFGA